ncbi:MULTISPECIES: thioesterase II family protein [Streptomycetaceae]|nr:MULTISPECIES: alpha/beta fold hydrolase [Streptomycetaceae]MYS61137.1 alpha/beta fold hydrolase [Streptomyces sp. SID5468]CCB76982.1 Type II thioesterase [Streptantibioticus cattleyicolor NRRL 8057 = DSM 46488]
MEKHVAQDTTGWIRILDPAPDARIRMVCCPHAGASARALTPLARALPGHVEALCVQYPGRQGGAGEPVDDIRELAGRIRDELRPYDDGRPFAVYGHSMGSVVAFEVTRALEADGVRPVRLFVSGRRSPSDGLGVENLPRTDEEIVAELRELGAVPAGLLEKPKFRQAVLTVVRNDYRANSGYLADLFSETVAAPVTFLLSSADPYVDADAARGWRRHTTGGFSLASFPGGHFFLGEQLAQVVEVMTAELATGPALPQQRAERATGGRR